jgi:hypothetical protein
MRQLLTAVLCLSLFAVLEAAKIKVKAEPDPTFDFAAVRTWQWDADAGEVIMARTPSDDPAALKARVDPMIRKYVAAAMVKQGLTVAASGTPDIHLHYYVLVTIGSSGQYMGQFLPTVPYWGLPAFSYGAATSLSVVTKGSLVLDALLPGAAGERKVIWRGIAESTVGDGDSPSAREARIRDAAAGLVEKFPLKKKK